jgi:hypothetical protein
VMLPAHANRPMLMLLYVCRSQVAPASVEKHTEYVPAAGNGDCICVRGAPGPVLGPFSVRILQASIGKHTRRTRKLLRLTGRQTTSGDAHVPPLVKPRRARAAPRLTPPPIVSNVLRVWAATINGPTSSTVVGELAAADGHDRQLVCMRLFRLHQHGITDR